MDNATFLKALQSRVATFNDAVGTKEGDWVVKGFIDVARNIYTLSLDTKVISKVMELLLLPELARFAEAHRLKMVLAEHQNFYPDVTFVDPRGHRFALDIKSTYRLSARQVNGMTLGAFTGYFRDRRSKKNITFPYESYQGHFTLGIVYSQVPEAVRHAGKYTLDELESIASVISDFAFFAQEKFRIASDRPGSGNTKNIGSVTDMARLVEGKGPFAELGQEVFDDYWMFYLTADMARAAELPKRPYTNLKSYLKHKGLT
ncbi:MAG: restriction endonuclease [Planctomycetes bacterium]|nr:restriction endonuclease [Planctomycetota bacterium]